MKVYLLGNVSMPDKSWLCFIINIFQMKLSLNLTLSVAIFPVLRI